MNALNMNKEKSFAVPEVKRKVSKSVTSPSRAVKATSNSTAKVKKEVNKSDAAKEAPLKKVPTKKAAAKNADNKAFIFDQEIMGKLKKMVANYTEYPELLDSIERDTTKSFIDELNIDSVDFVEIIVDVEEEFNINIEDDEIYSLNSFEDLYFAIESKIKGTHK